MGLVHKTKHNDGFSLVELMVVLAILGLLGIIAAPSLMQGIPRYRVDSAAKALATEMQLARLRAIAKNNKHKVTFNADNTILIEEVEFDEVTLINSVKTISLGVNGTDYRGVNLYRNATAASADLFIEAGNAIAQFGPDDDDFVIFLPNGQTTFSGEFYLIPSGDVGSEDSRIRAIQVLRAGLVRKLRYDGATWDRYK